MPQASTNRVRLAIVEEQSFGVTPASPAFRTLLNTGSTLAGSPETRISDTIVSDRNVSDLILLGKEVGGDINFEFQHLNPDLLLEGMMFSSWSKTAERKNEEASQITAVASTTYTVTGTQNFRQYHLLRATGFTNPANNKVFAAGAATSATSIVHTGGTAEASPPATARLKVVGVEGPSGDIVATANGLTSTLVNFVNMGITVGMWIYVGGNQTANQFATAGVRGWCRVATVAANAITWSRKPSTWTTDTGTGKTIRLYFGDTMSNGVLHKSYTLERAYLDITQFEYFRGCRVGTGKLEAKAKSILTGGATLVGSGHEIVQSRFAGATDLAAPTTPVWNGSSNIGALSQNGVLLTDPNFVTSFMLQVNNNLRTINPLGFLTAQGINAGEANIEAGLEAYFGDATLLNYVVNNTELSFDMPVLDAFGCGMVVDLPRIKMKSGQPSVPGKDQDVMTPLSMQALKDPTLGFALQLNRVEVVGA